MQDWQRLKNTELAGNETVHVEPSFSFTTGVVKEKEYWTMCSIKSSYLFHL